MKKVTQISVLVVILLNCCLSFADEDADKKAYFQWLSACKDYKDVGNWLAKNFTYDFDKWKYVVQLGPESRPEIIYKPWTTFMKKGGVCTDAAYFVKYSLNKVNPGYKADAIYLCTGKIPGHFVCGFFLGDNLYVMGYGVPRSARQRGTWGPFNNLDEYVSKCYLVFSEKKKLMSWHFGYRTAEEKEIEFSNTPRRGARIN